MKRLPIDPGACFDASLDTAISNHADDGIIISPGDSPDKVLAMLSNTFVLNMWEIGSGTTYLGRASRTTEGASGLAMAFVEK